jgi:SAM-dependent methyltransferase
MNGMKERMSIPNTYDHILTIPDIPESVKHYWGYQYRLAQETLVPYLHRVGAFTAGGSVAEIGCAEAGVLMAFMEAGATNALGTDLATHRLESGQAIAASLGLSPTLSTHDVLFDEPRSEWLHAFDLVILRDVIEHLDDAGLALRNIQKLLKPGGSVFVEFPPYNSPFGGHQHLLRNFWGKFPYAHLLPQPLFDHMTASGWHDVDIAEVRRLHKIRLSPKRFLKAAREAGYEVVREQYYLLRPVFRMKFGLPAISLTPLKWLPGVKEMLSLEANYVLRFSRNIH